MDDILNAIKTRTNSSFKYQEMLNSLNLRTQNTPDTLILPSSPNVSSIGSFLVAGFTIA